jgi:hypothetical protein
MRLNTTYWARQSLICHGTQRRDHNLRPADGSTPRIPSSGDTPGAASAHPKNARGGCHGATAIIALTHDPRIDDLAMMEAMRTPAYYIGVMGSKRTSKNRAERLARSGGLSPQQIARIRMPIGMDLGSKSRHKSRCRRSPISSGPPTAGSEPSAGALALGRRHPIMRRSGFSRERVWHRWRWFATKVAPTGGAGARLYVGAASAANGYGTDGGGSRLKSLLQVAPAADYA